MDVLLHSLQQGAVCRSLTSSHQDLRCQVLQKAVNLQPAYAEAHYDLGVAYNKLGRNREAVGAYQQAIHFKPDFFQAQNRLGVAYNDWGKRNEAMKAYREAIRLKPDYPEAFNNLGTAQAEAGKYKEAIESFRQAIGFKPELAIAHYNLGVVSVLAKNRVAALVQHELLKTLAPPAADKLYAGIYQGKLLSVAPIR